MHDAHRAPCARRLTPALIKLGMPDFAAHMFIIYYAVLSEVSPPTALSPFAAVAITGGDPAAEAPAAGGTVVGVIVTG